MRKVYVDVVALHDKNGIVLPLSITWEDGSTYDIDKVVDKCKAASLKVGGIGTRYRCRIKRTETYLFYEQGKWFVEGKV